MPSRQLSKIDHVLAQIDHGLRILLGDTPRPKRESPAFSIKETQLTDQERAHSMGLMRVNHSGEVCAQALYQGQAMTAKLSKVSEHMKHAADEEVDHLAWCKERVLQLGGSPSILNPVWYVTSFFLGATAGLVSDELSLGFVMASEEQVCQHLRKHLHELPINDEKSRKIVEQMLIDEEKHAEVALQAGGQHFPKPLKMMMTFVSNAMTKGSYRI
jgi:ubiquinone biosynthesis monooxygenase Coq7